MQFREIILIQSSIDNGRIYFPINDAKFFPADSLADRASDGHKGESILFRAGGFEIESDVRISSGQRVSPRKTFAAFLKSVSALAGDKLRVTRDGDREYTVEHIRV
jgi:hypothetical protein